MAQHSEQELETPEGMFDVMDSKSKESSTAEDDIAETLKELQQEEQAYGIGKEEVEKEIKDMEEKGEVPKEKKEVSNEGYSDIELKALSMGWTPEEEWKGPKEEYKSPQEYVRNASFFKKIEAQNRKIDELKQVINTMAQTLSRSQQEAYDEKMDVLQSQKALAKQEFDLDRYEALVEQEKKLLQKTAQQVKSVAPKLQQPSNPFETEEGKEFLQNNDWVTRNDEQSEKMKIHATMLTQKIAQQGQEMPLPEMLNYIHKEIRRLYPEQFRRQASAPKQVSSKTSTSSKHESISVSSEQRIMEGLTPEEQMVAEYLKDNNQDYKAYIKEVKLQHKKTK